MNVSLALFLASIACFLISGGSPDVFRGAVLPLIGIVLLLSSAVMFVSARMQGIASPEIAYVPSAEELRRLEASKAELELKNREQQLKLETDKAESKARMEALKTAAPKITGRAVFEVPDPASADPAKPAPPKSAP